MTTTTQTTAATTSHSISTPPAIGADIVGTRLNITFADGRALELEATELTPEMQHAAMMHGLKQKLVDAGAIARNTMTGKSASLSDKFDAIEEVFNRITGAAPTWNKQRGEGTGGNGGGSLKRALMQMTGKTSAQIDAYLEAKTKEEKTALKKNAKVAEIILELQTAGADEGIDTDALLDELNEE